MRVRLFLVKIRSHPADTSAVVLFARFYQLYDDRTIPAEDRLQGMVLYCKVCPFALGWVLAWGDCKR